MKRFLIIYGCHGAGKSTLARTLLSESGQPAELQCIYGRYSLSEDKKLVTVGKYSNSIGGADGVKSIDNMLNMVEYLHKHYPTAKIIVEGILLSSMFSRPLKFFLHLKYDYGFDIEQVFLNVSPLTAFKRVKTRSNGNPNPKNIIGKQKSVYKNFKKFAQLGEFRTLVINTDNLTAQEVLAEFKKKSEFYK